MWHGRGWHPYIRAGRSTPTIRACWGTRHAAATGIALVASVAAQPPPATLQMEEVRRTRSICDCPACRHHPAHHRPSGAAFAVAPTIPKHDAACQAAACPFRGRGVSPYNCVTTNDALGGVDNHGSRPKPGSCTLCVGGAQAAGTSTDHPPACRPSFRPPSNASGMIRLRMACGRSAAHPGSPPRAPRLGRQENRCAGEPQSAGIRSLPGAPNLGEPPEQLRGRVEAGVEPRSAGGIVSLGDESDCAQLSPAVRTALSRQRHTVECFHFPPRFLPNSRQLHSAYTTRPRQRFYLAIRLITIRPSRCDLPRQWQQPAVYHPRPARYASRAATIRSSGRCPVVRANSSY